MAIALAIGIAAVLGFVLGWGFAWMRQTGEEELATLDLPLLAERADLDPELRPADRCQPRGHESAERSSELIRDLVPQEAPIVRQASDRRLDQGVEGSPQVDRRVGRRLPSEDLATTAPVRP